MEIFSNDKAGDTSYAVVSAVAKSLKKYDYQRAKPMVLHDFLTCASPTRQVLMLDQVLRSFLALDFSKVTPESIKRMHLTKKQRKRMSRQKRVVCALFCCGIPAVSRYLVSVIVRCSYSGHLTDATAVVLELTGGAEIS